MASERTSIALSAANALERVGPDTLAGVDALVGFDGFIDAIIDVVDQRASMAESDYVSFRTIDQFAVRVGAASGKSTNIELVVKEERFGGNGPLMAGGLGRAGMRVTFIGCVGKPDAPRELHPIFADFARRCHHVVPVAPPARTDALEFDDGKVMLCKTRDIQRVTWDFLTSTLGLDTLRAMFARARLVGVVNWVMMGGIESVWEGLCRDVLPGLPPPPAVGSLPAGNRRMFIDLCDPAKRTDADIARALRMIQALNVHLPVTLGLNLAEAERIAAVLKLDVLGAYDTESLGQRVREAAAAIRDRLNIAAVVIHPRQGAGAASVEDPASSAWFEGPFTARPRLSTGAGDHFNAGFALAQSLGLTLPECLAVGCATSGVYVRDAASPTLARLIEFLRDLPAPERAH